MTTFQDNNQEQRGNYESASKGEKYVASLKGTVVQEATNTILHNLTTVKIHINFNWTIPLMAFQLYHMFPLIVKKEHKDKKKLAEVYEITKF